MIFEVLNEAAQRDELLLVDGAMCRYHRRRDGVAVIREILVLPECRRRGIGRKLLERIIGRHNCPVQAKCPTDLPANGWYEHMGFARTGIEKTTSGRKVNVWFLPRRD